MSDWFTGGRAVGTGTKDCPGCDGAFLEMGYIRELNILWKELCPCRFPNIERQHPLHKTMRLDERK